jgi:hypothetical protein
MVEGSDRFLIELNSQLTLIENLHELLMMKVFPSQVGLCTCGGRLLADPGDSSISVLHWSIDFDGI